MHTSVRSDFGACPGGTSPRRH